MNNILKKIKTECSEFLEGSEGHYAQKPLLFDGRFLKKVKVRKKSNKNASTQVLDAAFDAAFEGEYRDIMGRSVLCNGIHSLSVERTRPEFYVFPINGFKFLYNPEMDYYKEYQRIYKNLQKNMDIRAAMKTFVDMIEYSYKKDDVTLTDALLSGKEIVFYNMPYFFAVSKAKHPDYGKLLKMIAGQPVL